MESVIAIMKAENRLKLTVIFYMRKNVDIEG